ncbi:TetR/AcrR family transcriptional regulator [Actinomadura hibisca]|uniref:TetR/AcrR family transcriptional regulator n=1 Tax=Actinomadura hibisca TaxID=68565 RepID=UPI0008368D2B|nr:TetR/AcrR family transcriptional regulator [Actinomadura hibisca]
MSDTEYVSIWMRPERPARGPKPAYSRAQITEAAVRIADAEGLEAASMRRIAAEIGAGAMSLYRYVPSREDLVELMYDHVFGEQALPDRPSGDWRADLTLMAHAMRATLLRHPWVAVAPRGRPSIGPNQLRLTEFGAGALDLGIPIDDILTYAGLLHGYVANVTRDELAWIEEKRRSGMSPEDLMVRNSPYVRRLLASGRYPMFQRIVMDARQPHMSMDERFAYGLERVLKCIEAALPDDVREAAAERARNAVSSSGGAVGAEG